MARRRAKRREMYPGAHLPSVEDAVRAGAICSKCRRCAPAVGGRWCELCRASKGVYARKAYASRLDSGVCVTCGKVPASVGKAQCDRCGKKNREKFGSQLRARRSEARCIRCGGDRTEGAYCGGCKSEMTKWQGIRRAMMAGAEAEAVDRMAVFARDGWRCQICGGMTARARIGANHPKAPELDHRVPLARGGAHTYDNCQTAHRRCNLKKNAHSSVGQIPLWSGAGAVT